MGKLKYRFKGDRPVILREQLVKPGDAYDTDEEVVHGEFEPTNQAAKDAAAATEKLNAELQAAHDAERAGTARHQVGEPAPAAAEPAPAPAAHKEG